MSTVWTERADYHPQMPSNNFNLSFTNNFTTKLGQITPVFCKETIPGDTFHIDMALGLRALPMVFPIQTPVIAEVEAYYCPIRILWKDAKDFLFNNKERVHPYLAIPYTRAAEIGTGTLADYLNIPTTYAGPYGGMFSISLSGSVNPFTNPSNSITGQALIESQEGVPTAVNFSDVLSGSELNRLRYIQPYIIDQNNYSLFNQDGNGEFVGYLTTPISYIPSEIRFNNSQNIPDGTYNIYIRCYGVYRDSVGNMTDENSPYIGTIQDGMTLQISSGKAVINIDDTRKARFAQYLEQYGEIRLFIFQEYNSQDTDLFPYPLAATPDGSEPFIGSPALIVTDENIVGDVSPELNPFVIQSGETLPAIPLSILPWRAYESIYNTYKRNNFLNPLRINGEVEYNEVVTNRESGADAITPLNLRNRNYELDYLTDARTSPQQGIAPLIGVTAGGQATFEDQNGVTYKVDFKTNDDGDLVQGIQAYDKGIPSGSLKQLSQAIAYGISISTLRSTNALQVWLETNIRRGFKYEDQMWSHFGINVSKLELSEPIFLGGFQRRLEISEVTSLAKSDGLELGELAGKASLMTESNHTINYHCQEHGILMITLTLTPVPCYTQLLPKLFLKSSPLDYFAETFQHLSYQPITYREVCPIQSFIAGDDPDDVFGYQRPYYDLVANVDEAHGRMRTDLQNYLLTRVFGSRPQLSQSFIEVDPRELTNPFVDTSVSADNFIGQIYFDVKAKRQVSKLAIARLEP